MNKEEFIAFLKEKENELEFQTHWAKVAINSDDYWHLYKPAVDWLEDYMDLTKDNIVQITYNQSLYNDTSKIFETTYDDFVENYHKTIK
jgi:hypothetical protein